MTAEPALPDGGAVDLGALAQTRLGPIPLWTEQSADLHINLPSFEAGTGVAEHVNTELDVLLVGVAGEGVVAIDAVAHTLRPGYAVLIPTGTQRAIQNRGNVPFSYLSCHCRRALLWPQTTPRAQTPGNPDASPCSNGGPAAPGRNPGTLNAANRGTAVEHVLPQTTRERRGAQDHGRKPGNRSAAARAGLG